MTGGGDSGTDGGAVRRPGLPVRGVYALIALGTAAACLVNAFSTAHDLARLGRAVPFWQPLLWEASSAILIVALLPLARWIYRRGAGLGDRVALLVLLHLAGALAFCVLHVAGMVLLRMAGYALLSDDAYSFGPPMAGFLYELRKDVLVYALIMSVFWVAGRVTSSARDGVDADSHDGSPDGGRLAPAPAAPDTPLWLRDGTVSVRVAPSEIVWAASAGNYVEFALASGQKHLIRTTLQAEEERLKPLGFVRIHRTRLVNAARIRRIGTRPSGDFDVELDTGESLVGSRRYRADALALLRPPA